MMIVVCSVTSPGVYVESNGRLLPSKYEDRKTNKI